MGGVMMIHKIWAGPINKAVLDALWNEFRKELRLRGTGRHVDGSFFISHEYDNGTRIFMVTPLHGTRIQRLFITGYDAELVITREQNGNYQTCTRVC